MSPSSMYVCISEVLHRFLFYYWFRHLPATWKSPEVCLKISSLSPAPQNFQLSVCLHGQILISSHHPPAKKTIALSS